MDPTGDNDSKTKQQPLRRKGGGSNGNGATNESQPPRYSRLTIFVTSLMALAVLSLISASIFNTRFLSSFRELTTEGNGFRTIRLPSSQGKKDDDDDGQQSSLIKEKLAFGHNHKRNNTTSKNEKKTLITWRGQSIENKTANNGFSYPGKSLGEVPQIKVMKQAHRNGSRVIWLMSFPNSVSVCDLLEDIRRKWFKQDIVVSNEHMCCSLLPLRTISFYIIIHRGRRTR